MNRGRLAVAKRNLREKRKCTGLYSQGDNEEAAETEPGDNYNENEVFPESPLETLSFEIPSSNYQSHNPSDSNYPTCSLHKSITFPLAKAFADRQISIRVEEDQLNIESPKSKDFSPDQDEDNNKLRSMLEEEQETNAFLSKQLETSETKIRSLEKEINRLKKEIDKIKDSKKDI